MLLGAHTIDNGGIHMAARRAGAAGMRALQIFTAVPKYYGDKSSMKPERVERFRGALAGTEIDLAHVVAHGAYVLNTATADEEKWTRARDGLTKELERSTTLGIGAVCYHPGAATSGDTEAALERVAKAIVHALETVEEGPTRLLLENTAGAGRTVGRTPEEIGTILGAIPKRLRTAPDTASTPVTCTPPASTSAPRAARSPRCSTRSRRRRGSRRRSSTSTTARGRWARTRTGTC